MPSFSIVIDLTDESDCQQQLFLHDLFGRVGRDVTFVKARVRLGQMLVAAHATSLECMDALLFAQISGQLAPPIHKGQVQLAVFMIHILKYLPEPGSPFRVSRGKVVPIVGELLEQFDINLIPTAASFFKVPPAQ